MDYHFLFAAPPPDEMHRIVRDTFRHYVTEGRPYGIDHNGLCKFSVEPDARCAVGRLLPEDVRKDLAEAGINTLEAMFGSDSDHVAGFYRSLMVAHDRAALLGHRKEQNRSLAKSLTLLCVIHGAAIPDELRWYIMRDGILRANLMQHLVDGPETLTPF
jgi:hypothetical protein